MKPTKTEFHFKATGTSTLLFGRRETATYTDTLIPRYQGNPLIEALPPILSDDDISDQLAYYPPYEKTHRALPAEQRIHIIHTILDLLIPFPENVDLAQRFSCLIREGYVARNPIAAEFWQKFRSRAEHQRDNGNARVRVRSSAPGMTIMGISGGGKTTATEAAIGLYPQLIQHSIFQGRPFTWTQVVWLKLQCPFDGSTRGLCLNFFQAIDELLGTNHYRNYGEGRKSTDELMPAMRRVASLHSLGLLLIDELQHLDQSRTGKEIMLNFFTELVNEIGVPIVFIGTPKVKSVLAGEFRQSRRGTSEGDFVWNRMENDEKWRYFAESLWDYQYLQKPTPPSEELFDVLYDESQGIIDIAVKLFMLSQVRAVRKKLEILNVNIIRSVASDSLRTIQRALDALRRGDYEALKAIPDIQPIDYDEAVRKISNADRLKNLAGRREAPTTRAGVSPDKMTGTMETAAAGGTLMEIVKQAGQSKGDPRETLKSKGVVRDVAEYLS
jgi:hypothetical protein